MTETQPHPLTVAARILDENGSPDLARQVRKEHQRRNFAALGEFGRNFNRTAAEAINRFAVAFAENRRTGAQAPITNATGPDPLSCILGQVTEEDPTPPAGEPADIAAAVAALRQAFGVPDGEQATFVVEAPAAGEPFRLRQATARIIRLRGKDLTVSDEE